MKRTALLIGAIFTIITVTATAIFASAPIFHTMWGTYGWANVSNMDIVFVKQSFFDSLDSVSAVVFDNLLKFGSNPLIFSGKSVVLMLKIGKSDFGYTAQFANPVNREKPFFNLLSCEPNSQNLYRLKIFPAYQLRDCKCGNIYRFLRQLAD